MSDHFDAFVSGPRRARRNRTPDATGSRNHAGATQHRNFDGFFAGPRAAR
jgi:hypothetical protein